MKRAWYVLGMSVFFAVGVLVCRGNWWSKCFRWHWVDRTVQGERTKECWQDTGKAPVCVDLATDSQFHPSKLPVGPRVAIHGNFWTVDGECVKIIVERSHAFFGGGYGLSAMHYPDEWCREGVKKP